MWYYAQGGQRRGPVSEEVLRNMARAGELSPTDLVWREGMAEWAAAGQATDFEFGSGTGGGGEPAPPPAAETPASPSPSYAQQTPSYGQPPSYAQQPATPYAPPSAAVEPGGESIPDYLPWSIGATLLCCVPAGIAAIVYSVKANSAKKIGDWAEAQRSAKLAKTWLWVSVGVGLAVLLIYVLAIIGGGLSDL